MATARAGFYSQPYRFSSSKSAYRGPDPGLVAWQLNRLQALYATYGKAFFSEQFFWIIRKNPEPGDKDILANKSTHWNKRLIPFKHNRIQLDLDAKMGTRNILLKPRQGGYTTYVLLMRLLAPAILEPGSGGLLISQNYKYVAAHFGLLQRAFKLFGVQDPFDKSKNFLSEQLHQHLLHTAYSNRRELIFDALDSRILCESAENEEAGQGVTIQHLHCSEVARWPGNPEETLANVKEAIPMDGTVDLESTANLMGGYFYEECMRARDPGNKLISEFKYHFHEWWWHDEYRLEPGAKVESLTDEEKTLRKSFNLDLDQIAWRRKKMVSLRHNFLEKYPENDITCFLVQGNTFFDKDILGQRYFELMQEKAHDIFKKFTIFKPRQKHKRFVIAADVAAGRFASTDNPDYSAAVVLDLETGEEYGWYRARLAEEDFAQDLAEMGRMYNNAIIAVERGGYGGTTLVTLEVACQYTNLYKHKDWWKRDKTKVIEFVGFPTTVKTRGVALNRIKYFVQEAPELIHDPTFVQEALTFVYNDKGKPEATPGAHDDTVMCRAIGHYVRQVLLGHLDPLSVPGEKYGMTPGEFAEDEEFEGPPQ